MRTCLLSFFLIICFVGMMPNWLSAQVAADADFDGSGQVDFADFILFARAYNSAEIRYDLDGGGRVDFQDFLLFSSFFGTETSAPDFTFPLATGNIWKYRVSAERSLLVSSRLEEHIQWTVDVTWEIKEKETVFGIEAYRFENTYHFLSGPDSGKVVTGWTWFAMEGDTLWAVASKDIGEFSPASAQLHKPTLSFNQDMPHGWGVVVLVFPLEVGREWDYGFSLLPSQKVVEAFESVSAIDKTFDAFKVTRIVDNPTIQFRIEQWFSSVGLVRMREEMSSVQDRMDAQGNVIEKDGVVNRSNAVMELESYQLKN